MRTQKEIDWVHKLWPPGTRVYVTDIHDKYLGEGRLLYPYGGTDDERDQQPMPEIKLDDGGLIQGCECWWLPIMVADSPG